MRLWTKRGHCPNRKELISKFFFPVFDMKAKPVWICNFSNDDTVFIPSKTERLPFLFISETKKLFFIPHPSLEDELYSIVHGYFLCLKRSEQDNTEFIGDELILYPLYFEDMKYYFPPPSDDFFFEKKRYYPTKKEVRYVFGKWDALIERKIDENERYIFYPQGFTRLKFQTTGRITGSWTG